jgi:hypothetical protein
MIVGAAPPSALGAVLSVMPREDAIASCGERGEEVLRCEARCRQACAHLLAELLETVLLREEDEAVSHSKNRKRGAGPEAKILAELFRDSKLALFADPGGGQVFESRVARCHG